MKFRSDINGLRAYAVVAVLLFHFSLPGFQGGFIGVDVFFVISGFLMSGIIFTKMERGTFSLLGFYLDRARRIIPALVAMCLVVLIAGWVLLPAPEYTILGRHVVSALTFVSNHLFRSEANYFDASSHENWLLHTWSLSVEWQFYLLYPIGLLILKKVVPASWTRWILLAITGLSLLLSIFISSRSPTAAFYLLPTRTWEMLAGALVFLFPVRWPTRVLAGIEYAGVGLLAFGTAFFSATDVWPGSLALVPVLGAAMILVAANSESFLTNNPLAQYLGKISYSLYLWHWPMVVALNYFGRTDQLLWVTAGIAASLVSAHLSYLAIESRRRPVGAKPSGSLALAAPVVIAAITTTCIGFGISHLAGIPGSIRPVNLDERTLFLAKYQDLHKNGLRDAYRNECDFYDWDTNKAKPSIAKECTDGPGMAPVFLWGDSHAQALSTGLRSLYPHERVAQVATSGCVPSLLPPVGPSIDNNCALSNQHALKEIARTRPPIVVLAQAAHHENTDWTMMANRLHALGVKQVVLVGPMPNWKPSLPLIIARRHWGDAFVHVRDGLDSAPFQTDTILEKRYAQSRNLAYVSLTNHLCDTTGCIAVAPADRTLLVVDYGHLSPSGSVYVSQSILRLALNDANGALQLTEKRQNSESR